MCNYFLFYLSRLTLKKIETKESITGKISERIRSLLWFKKKDATQETDDEKSSVDKDCKENDGPDSGDSNHHSEDIVNNGVCDDGVESSNVRNRNNSEIR